MIQIDLEIPKCCDECKFVYDSCKCIITGSRIDWDKFDSERLLDCPLNKIAEPKIVPIAEIKFDDDMLHEMVKEAVKNIEIEPKWIPVSERLPEEDGRYLCTYEDDIYENCVDFGSYENGEWYVDKVIAWMPLPEPYKAESEEV